MYNNVIEEGTRMDEYEKLLRDVIEKYDLMVKVEETEPGDECSVITCIKIDLRCIGIHADIILIPSDEYYNAQKGINKLQFFLNAEIERHENMSFYNYSKYKRDDRWDDAVELYEEWKEIESFVSSRLKVIKEDK